MSGAGASCLLHEDFYRFAPLGLAFGLDLSAMATFNLRLAKIFDRVAAGPSR